MILDLLAAGFAQRSTWKIAGGHPRDPVIADLLGLGSSTKSGLVVTEKTSLTHSGVWRAVNFRSMVMGDIPVSVYRRNADGGKTRLDDHPIQVLLHDIANSELSISAFTRQQTAENHVLTWGNEFSWIERSRGGVPVSIWPHPPNAVTVDVTRSGKLFYTFLGMREKDKDYSPADIIHHKGMSPDLLVGWSRIRMARESIGQSLAAQQFGGAYFGHGARPGMIITTLPGFKPEDARLLKESIAKQVTGPDNWHSLLVAPGADKITPISVPPEDAQFIATQEWGIAECGRWFDVPLVFMMLPNSEPRANAEQDTLNFVVTTITPECRNFEQELNQKLLSQSERNAGIFVEHNVDALLRGDFKSRMEGYGIGLDKGLFSRDDCLRRENMEPIGKERGGEIHTVPVNAMNLEALIGQKAPPAAVTPAAKIGEPPARAVDWLAIYEPLFADAAERLLAKERKAIEAMMGKSRSHNNLAADIRAFYAGHDNAVLFVLNPVLQSLSVANEQDMDAARTLGIWIAERYCYAACAEEWPSWSGEKARAFMAGQCRMAIRELIGDDNGKRNDSRGQN